MKSLMLALPLVLAATAAAEFSPAPASPAERRIAAAQTVLQKQPDRYQAYNDLALALIRRARETGDTAYDQQAERAIQKSLQIQPGNFEGEQAHVALLLSERRYREALAEAQELNHRTPDAVLVWGYMAEARAALGDYDEAERSAQWMMDLRPGNAPAFLVGASLREAWGDIDGALDFLSKALQETPPLETEETAWILTGMARLHRTSGELDQADSVLQQALKTFSGYYPALEELARVRMARRCYSEAVELVERRNRNLPTPQSRYLLGEALELAGRTADARQAYVDFEREARRQIDQPDNANRELVLYYAEYQPVEALRIAQLEAERRHDVWTLDAYAWALFANRQYAEARREIGTAIAVGTHDVEVLRHAEVIARASADNRAANRAER